MGRTTSKARRDHPPEQPPTHAPVPRTVSDLEFHRKNDDYVNVNVVNDQENDQVNVKAADVPATGPVKVNATRTSTSTSASTSTSTSTST